MKANPGSLVLLTLLALGTQETLAMKFRCGFLGFLGKDKACSASCWVTGHDTGHCDDNNDCICSEEENDVSEGIKDLLGGVDIIDFVGQKVKDFKNEVQDWELPESIREKAPSRCALGNSFCESTCHSIGRVTGSCNSDNSDCTCSERTVTPRQFALCVDDGVCSVFCQRKGMAKGECRGPDKWDCMCLSKKKANKEAEFIPVVDLADYEQ